MSFFSDANSQVRAPTGKPAGKQRYFSKLIILKEKKIEILRLEDPKPDDFSLSLYSASFMHPSRTHCCFLPSTTRTNVCPLGTSRNFRELLVMLDELNKRWGRVSIDCWLLNSAQLLLPSRSLWTRCFGYNEDSSQQEEKEKVCFFVFCSLLKTVVCLVHRHLSRFAPLLWPDGFVFCFAFLSHVSIWGKSPSQTLWKIPSLSNTSIQSREICLASGDAPPRAQGFTAMQPR